MCTTLDNDAYYNYYMQLQIEKIERIIINT